MEVGAMDGRRTEMLTSCRRRIHAGRFRIPSAPGIERVVLRIEPVDDCCETVWASLTTDEAVTLARALLAQAGAIKA
jgi:hypothetical protein